MTCTMHTHWIKKGRQKNKWTKNLEFKKKITKLENICQKELGKENHLQAPRAARVNVWNSDSMSEWTALSPRAAWNHCWMNWLSQPGQTSHCWGWRKLSYLIVKKCPHHLLAHALCEDNSAKKVFYLRSDQVVQMATLGFWDDSFFQIVFIKFPYVQHCAKFFKCNKDAIYGT